MENRKAPFQFSMVGIKVGEDLVFTPTGEIVHVADEKNKIEDTQRNHRLWTLSGFTTEFMPEEKKNTSGAYQGPKYFTYKGEPLDVLRNRIEKNDKE
ncbi:MAG: hypothetical protein HUJ98_13020 [Bacteroidaceae bacterium]|nr:hypothetical protein [Bacteroidaceae bacterium]